MMWSSDPLEMLERCRRWQGKKEREEDQNKLSNNKNKFLEGIKAVAQNSLGADVQAVSDQERFLTET